MPQPINDRSIADRSGDVRASLLDLLDKAKTTEAPIEQQEAGDILDRFKLWTGNLGALHQAHKRMSLESRLADSPEVRGQICEQLEDMQEAIQDLLTLCSETGTNLDLHIVDEQDHPASDNFLAGDILPDTEDTPKKSEAISILRMVSECLSALFRIGVLVRKATPRDRFERALQQSEFAFTPQFDIRYVQERYPKLASQDSHWLASRLGGANAKRRQFINYVREHKAKLEVEDIKPAVDAARTVKSSKATTFVVPGKLSAPEFLRSPLEVEDDSVSLVSASTAFNNDTSLRLPSLADLGPDGAYFECPICFTLQSFRMEKSWKMHAYRDLKAYVCVSGGVECEQQLFDDRDSWFNHELKHHHSLYLCKLCWYQYTDTKLLQQHLLDEHGMHSSEEILSIIEHGKLVPSQLKAKNCPFCDDWASILSHRRHQTEGRASSTIHQTDILVSLTHFKRHVATHQEQLAIFAVPRTVADDEERSHGDVEANSEAVSSKDDNNQLIENEAHPTEDSSSDNLCVYLSGLPPAVREADIENHFVLRGFGGITELKLMDDFAFIRFQDPDDVHRAVETLNGSILMGVRINPLPARFSPDHDRGETHVIDRPYADNSESIRAIDEIIAAYTHFRTTLLPICEDFIANPPSDPQKRQDQSTHIVTMIRQQVWSTVNFIDARNDIEVMAKKSEVLEDLDVMLERIRAVPITSMRDAEITAKDENQKSNQPKPDGYRVKLFNLRDNDWQDQGTGYCAVKIVETANERKETHIVVDSEEEPGRLMLDESVQQGDNFQRQQDTLIVWTQRQTSVDMALSFQEAADCDTIWKDIERNIDKELHAPSDWHDSLPDNGESVSASGKKHKCPYCDAEFTRHHNLKSHLFTHSQDKPYLCQTCNLRFRRLADLKRHGRLHTGESPHVCPKCNRKFERGDALARHSKGPCGCAGRRASVGSYANQGEYDGPARNEGHDAPMAEEEHRRTRPPLSAAATTSHPSPFTQFLRDTHADDHAVLVQRLPPETTEQNLRLICTFSEELIDINILGLSLEPDGSYCSAVLRFKSFRGAQEARTVLNGKKGMRVDQLGPGSPLDDSRSNSSPFLSSMRAQPPETHFREDTSKGFVIQTRARQEENQMSPQEQQGLGKRAADEARSRTLEDEENMQGDVARRAGKSRNDMLEELTRRLEEE